MSLTNNQEITFDVLSPWMRQIDQSTLINLLEPILIETKPIPKYLTLMSENISSDLINKKVKWKIFANISHYIQY